MKKLLLVAMSALLLAGCGGGAAADEHPDHWSVMGNGNFSNGEVANWDGQDEVSFMKKLDLAEAKRKVPALENKNVKEVYEYQHWGVTDFNWDGNPYAMVNGEKVQFKGGHAIKVAKMTWDKEAEKFVTTAWIPNPGDNAAFQIAHLEGLTDNVFVPAWQKDPDPNGFSWADNPVITSAEGNYTIIVAEYDVTPDATTANFGMAAMLENA